MDATTDNLFTNTNKAMMRKALLLLLGLLTGSTLLMAAPVKLEQAQQRALQFVNQLNRHGGSRSLHLARQQPRLAQATAGAASYYVFNVGDNQGFVMVSGDDRTAEILGYATDGSFVEAELPDNLRAWLQGYQDQIDWMDQHGYQPRMAAKAPARTAIAQLLTTTWDQDGPYNLFCPTFLSTTELCVTGCVATAMAQVLAYYGLKEGKPTGTTKPIPAYDCRKNWTDYGKMHINEKPVCTFDWANMLPSYNGSETDAQKQAVARLMEYCGASINMNYGNVANGGSSAYTQDVDDALKNYFSFDGTFTDREGYTYPQWENLIYNELAEGRPVLYGGRSSGGGHAFVVDGYQGDGLFHVNWGWGGWRDSYFVLSVLNPGDNSGIGASTSNDGYSYDQDAIIGIKPLTGTPAEEPLAMSLSQLSISGNTVSYLAYNLTGAENTFDLGLAFTTAEGTILKVMDNYKNRTFGLNSGNNFTFEISGSDMSAGTYHLVPVSKLSSAANWVVISAPKIYVEAVFDGAGNVTLTKYPQDFNLSVTNIIVKGSRFSGQKQDVEATILNEGGEFYGALYFFASQTDTKGDAANHGGATILKDESVDMVFNFTPNAPGTWNLWVATDEIGNNVIGTSTVEIAEDPYTPTGDFMVSALTIQGADGEWQVLPDGTRTVDVLNETGDITISATIKNVTAGSITVPDNYFRFTLQKKNSDDTWGNVASYVNSGALTISAGGEATWNGMPYGSRPYGTYRFMLRISDAEVDGHHVFNTAKEKIAIWNSDGTSGRQLLTDNTIPVEPTTDVVDLTGYADLSSYAITPSSNANCLYLLAEGAAVPAALTGKNVVIGSTAPSITIEDNANGFFSPVAFTAQEISYTRTFTTGYASDGSGWTTITLPFSVTSVTTGTEVLDWCHSASDEGKNFYLMEFSTDDASSVSFSHAANFQAQTPYLIAVAGPEFGDKWNLVGKPITFSAANATVPANKTIVTSGTNYRFHGNMTSMETTNMYKLNDAGTNFQLTASTSEHPFRAYFIDNGGSATSLHITFDGGQATGIADVTDSQADSQQQGVYNLNGVRLGQSLQQLPAGIYIVNGKKVIK